MPRKAVKGKKKAFNKSKKVVKTMAVKSMGVPGVVARTGGFRSNFGSGVGEKKTIDTVGPNLVGLNFNTTGAIILLNGVAQGTDYNARIGRKIVNASLYLRGEIFVEAARSLSVSSVVPAQTARLILLYDMQTNGVAPVLTDVLNATGGGSPENIGAQLNLNNRDRFKILKDKCFSFGPFVTDIGGSPSQIGMPLNYCFKIYKKLKLETIFGGTDASVGSITSGAIFLLAIGSNPAGPLDVNFNGSCRIRFMDP